MIIEDLVTQYLQFRRTLGERYESQGRWLRCFCRAVGPQTLVASITAAAVISFVAGRGPATRSWHDKYHTLKGLFRFAVSRGHLAEAPPPALLARKPPAFVPHIYSRDEIRRLLDAVPTYRRYRTRVEPETLRTIILLLYGAGLRPGEALNLTVADVDLANALLTIRETKFYKSRLVPIGGDLTRVLTGYARWRDEHHPTPGEGSRFLLCKWGYPIVLCTLQCAFHRLRAHAKVCRSGGPRNQPRLHDLRHAFAVHRLTEWYRQWADAQRLLYQLSVYLGHADLSSTQVYLTMTPELLHEAGTRFERYALGEGDHD
jgi:integrase/recombinase XerD